MRHGEIWRPIPGFEGCYEASDRGRVRSLDREVGSGHGSRRFIRGRMLKHGYANGYPLVVLSVDDVQTTMPIHRAVALTFLGGPFPGLQVCHNNGDRDNNCVENLRWDTPSGNNYDLVKHGTHHNLNKVACPRGHLLGPPNNVARESRRNRRSCLACARARSYQERYPDIDFEAVANDYYARIMREERNAA